MHFMWKPNMPLAKPKAALLIVIAASACSSPSEPNDRGVRERWYQVQPGVTWARPAVSASVVYFGTGDGRVIARDQVTGAAKWATTVGPDPVLGGNILLRRGVIVAPVLNYTLGLDAETGRILWRYEAPHDTAGRGSNTVTRPGQVVKSRIDGDDANVYIPAWGASVSAVDLQTGAVRWIWRPGQIAGDTAASGVFRSGAMSVRVAGDTVFATMWHNVTSTGAVSEAWVVALSRSTGAEFWRIRLPFEGSGVLIHGMPALYGNLVIVNTVSGRTYAIDRSTQNIAWQFNAPAGTLAKLSTVSQVELYADVVYVDGGDSNIYALYAATGAEKWRSAIRTQVTEDMLVTERRIVFTEGGTLYVLDRLSGARVASTTQPRTHDPLFSSGASYNAGLVFVNVADAAWCFEEP